MTAATLPLVLEQGISYSKVWNLRDSAGNPYDLTGYTARLQVRESYAAAAAILDLTTENGGLILGGALGTLEIVITEADFDAITVPDTPGTPPTLKAVYDLELVTGVTVIRLFQGPCTISREVTRG